MGCDLTQKFYIDVNYRNCNETHW